jgi:hypothetical protein
MLPALLHHTTVYVFKGMKNTKYLHPEQQLQFKPKRR